MTGPSWEDCVRLAEHAAAVARVQAWLADEREAGRCVLELQDAWIARLLEAGLRRHEVKT